jgi:hypothetical protein
MQAGFTKVDITPPTGTPLMGWGEAQDRPARAIHDPLFARILYVEHGGARALVVAFDYCFLGREESDRFKAVLGRELGLTPAQVLLVATHTHASPGIGGYLDLAYAAPLRDYLTGVGLALQRGGREAFQSRREVTLRAGTTTSRLPMNRRAVRGGRVVNAPNPGGPVIDSLPLCLLEDMDKKPVCLLFSIATHPVSFREPEVSADYPGVACDRLDQRLGATCAMFLQGCGGDSRPRPLGEGRDEWRWDSGWPETRAIGEELAAEVEAGLRSLKPSTPRVASALVETHFPFTTLSREHYAGIPHGLRLDGRAGLAFRWAQRQLARLDHGTLPEALPLLFQAIQLGQDVRLVAVEGEPVGAHGRAIERMFPTGTTFALGYANGEGMYLVTSAMLDEGGYEPESYWEYGHPGPLAKGIESVFEAALEGVRAGEIR